MKTLTILSTIVALNTTACSEEQQPKSCERPAAPDLQLELNSEDLTGTYELRFIPTQVVLEPSDAIEYIKSMKDVGVLHDVIMTLVREGTVCQYIGHDWEYSGISYSDEEYSRKCRICGKSQTRKPGEWK